MTSGSDYGGYATLEPGMDVYASDGDKVGTIREATEQSITVEKGFFFPKDYVIPISAVEGVDDNDRVYLLVTKDAALSEQWGTGMVSEPATSTSTGMATGGATGSTYGSAAGLQSEVIDPNFVAASDTPPSGSDATRVPVYAEDLTAVKRPVSRGAVRIEKELVTEERTVTVPVTEERVRITQVDTNEAVGTDVGDAFQEGVIEVPLRGEEVEVQKTARKTGEVIVEKEAVQHDEHVSGTLRREEVRVDDQTRSDEMDTTRTSRGRLPPPRTRTEKGYTINPREKKKSPKRARCRRTNPPKV